MKAKSAVRSLWSLLVCLVCAGCGPSISMNARVWPHPGEPAQNRYPEIAERIVGSDTSQSGASTLGLVFSGGGTRSASATLGQLRALAHLGWLDDVDYVAAVSGGSWTVVPWIYTQPEDDDAFLGAYRAPGTLTDEDFRDVSDSRQESAVAGIGYLVDNWFYHGLGFQGDEIYARILGDLFLDPHGIQHEHRLLTWSGSTRADARSRSSGELADEDFLTVPPGRPFWVVGGVVQETSPDAYLTIWPFEMTALYSGIPTNCVGRDSVSTRCANQMARDGLGGGYVETAGYDSELRELGSENGLARVEVPSERRRFTASDVIAISGAAPGSIFHSGIPRLFFANIGLPEHAHWPVREGARTREHPHSDGGNIDNIGLPMLLARGVDRIMVFINTETAFDSDALSPTESVYDDLYDYFHAADDAQPPDPNVNQVFPTSEFEELRLAFALRKAQGEPLVVCREHEVLENEIFGVFPLPDYTPTICWVYLDRTRAWVDALQRAPESQADIRAGNAPFSNFPHVRTFGQQIHDAQLIDLNPRHVNALAHLTSWTLVSEAGLIGTRLGLPVPE